jgi:hypothetical protein
MNAQNFSTTFTVDRTPQEAFAAINNVRGWWSGEIEGGTGKVGDEFTYRYQDLHYSKQKLTELIPGKKSGLAGVRRPPEFYERQDRVDGHGDCF